MSHTFNNAIIIYFKTPNGGKSLIWRRSGNHGMQWKIARTTIRPRAGRQIVFEGVRGLSFSGDIAIDDIRKTMGYCAPPGDCSFERGFCSWSNVKKSSLDQFDWIIGSGSTPSIFTGPSSDHTTGTKAGKYCFKLFVALVYTCICLLLLSDEYVS